MTRADTRIDRQLLLNQAIQDVLPVDALVKQFTDADADEQLALLRELATIISQAGVQPGDVDAAIANAPVKPTSTPAVLLRQGPLHVQLARVLNLPPSERSRSLYVLLALATIADERRRETQCDLGCTHWWHRDLSNPAVVADIRRSYFHPQPPALE